MRFSEFFKKDRNIALVLFFVVFLSKLPTMGLDYHWDAVLYSKQALFYAENGPFAVPGGRIAHVPLLQWITAMPFKVLGESPFVGHFIIALFSFIGVFFAYKTGKIIGGKKTGIVGAFFVFLSPAYFSISGQFLFDVPVTAATLAAVYYFAKNDVNGYLLSASAAVLLKETGILIVGAAILYAVFRERKKIVIYALPVLLTIIWQLWMSFNRPVSGFLISSSALNIPARLIAATYDALFMNYSWLLSILILYAIYKKKSVKGRLDILPITIAVYILFFGIVPVFMLPRYFMPATAIAAVWAAGSLTNTIKKYNIVALIVCFLLASTFAIHDGVKGLAEDPVYRGGIYENKITALKNGEMTMDYADFVKADEDAIKYIIANYSGKTVAAEFPIYEPEMANVDVGERQWLKNKIHVIPLNESKKADILVYQTCCSSFPLTNWPVEAEFKSNLQDIIIYKNPDK